jgi:hypothetical protein
MQYLVNAKTYAEGICSTFPFNLRTWKTMYTFRVRSGDIVHESW